MMSNRPAVWFLQAVLCMAALLTGSSCAKQPQAAPIVIESTLDGGRFRTVHTYRPSGAITNVALFFSGDGGWGPEVADMAQRLAAEGFLVAGVDTTIYMASIQPKDEHSKCTYAAGDVEALSQHLQWKFALPNYLRPVLFGYSAGSSLVYTALAQSPRGTFAGGAALSFCAEMDTDRARFCPGEGLQFSAMPSHREIELKPNAKFAFPWTVVHGDRDTVCSAAQTHKFVSAIPSARLILLTNADHDLTPVAAWWPQLRRDYRAMLVSDTAVGPVAVAPDELSDLPLAEVLATAPESDLFAVMISGDGGWAGLDQGVSGALAAHGIPVVGLNSLKYFWHARNADSTAHDVNRIVEQYAMRWHKKRVLLIGYSFGADVMPFVFNRLPEATRARVASVSFLGLGPGATYEVTVGEWLPGADKKGDPVVPEIAKMQSLPRLCVQGNGEKDSSCPQLEKLGVTVRLIGDGHHFSGLEDEIADAIVKVAGVSAARP
jgi:type IV secretory pathway VirJ component